MNRIFLSGNLGKDPELKYTNSGSPVCNFSMATKESWVGKDGQKNEKTCWHNIVVWGKLAELSNQYIKKGSKVLIEGSSETRSYDDKDGQKRYITEVNVRTVEFLDSKKENSSDSNNGFKPEERQEFTADNIPF